MEEIISNLELLTKHINSSLGTEFKEYEIEQAVCLYFTDIFNEKRNSDDFWTLFSLYATADTDPNMCLYPFCLCDNSMDCCNSGFTGGCNCGDKLDKYNYAGKIYRR